MHQIKINFEEKLGKARGVSPVFLSEEKESYVALLKSNQKAIYLGIGPKKEVNLRKFILIARKIISLAKANKVKRLAINFSDFQIPQLRLSDERIAEILATNFEMANFEFVDYKTSQEAKSNFVEEIIVCGKISEKVKYGFNKGGIIGKSVNECRVLANTPGGDMTPTKLAEAAIEGVKGLPIRVEILDEKEMEKLKMGAILGVARGSEEKPKFIILEYLPKKNENPIVLVGKGVTFDTGGINLKPETAILEMHLDMSGGAAAIYSVILAARLGIKKNVVALVPAVENMPSGSSYRPGDILTSMSGKTIEVLNTDAEGRLILADALTYAKRYNPKLVVDIATLTGAAIVALGQRASALFTKDEKLEKLFRELGEESGDYVWPLPLWDEFEEDIKGNFADYANVVAKNPGYRYAGAIIGAIFLYQFAKDYPWVHLDIAPRMTSIEGEYLAKGSAGAPVRLLIKLIERF